jgi:hypothetical protein
VDHVVDPGAADELHAWFRRIGYHFADADREDTGFVRHLVHYFEEEEWAGGTYVSLLVEAARSTLSTLELPFSKLERVYANFNLFGDQQFAHADGDCWTALVFINATWGEDWGGELMLYEGGPGSLAWAIPPRPGRMVVFDGTVLHRGGVPTKFCLDGRITLAIKFERA